MDVDKMASMMTRQKTLATVFIAAAALFVERGDNVWAQREASKTSAHVTVHLTAGKPDASGTQMVLVCLDIDPNYIVLGHNLPEDFKLSRLKVDFFANGKPVQARLTYPAGEKLEDLSGDYKIHRGKVMISGEVHRAPGDAGLLEASVRMQGFPKLRAY